MEWNFLHRPDAKNRSMAEKAIRDNEATRRSVADLERETGYLAAVGYELDFA